MANSVDDFIEKRKKELSKKVSSGSSVTGTAEDFIEKRKRELRQAQQPETQPRSYTGPDLDVRSRVPDLFDPSKAIFAPSAPIKTTPSSQLPSSIQAQIAPTVAPPRPSLGERIQTRFSEREKERDKARGIERIAGELLAPVVSGIDVVSEVVKPATPYLREAYELGVGGGLAAAPKLAAGVGTKLASVAPRLFGEANLGQRVAREAVAEGIVGAPISAGQALAGDSSISGRELAQQTALGSGLGFLGGAASPLIGAGIRQFGRVGQKAAQSAPESTITQQIDDSIPTLDTQETLAQPQTRTTSRTSSNVPGERSFMRTLQESGNLTEDVSRQLEVSPERTYEPITNRSTLDAANQRISQGIDKAEASLIGKKQYNAEDVATGLRLLQELQSSGQTERAVTIAENLSNRLTEAGQAVQAASIWNRLSPEGALLAAQRRVNTVNENLLKGQTPVKITPDQAQAIQDTAGAIQAAGASQERSAAVSDILERVRQGGTVSTEEKQALADFVQDAKRFLKSSDTRPPKQAGIPKEMRDTRVRDRVTSFLEAQEAAAKERLRAKGVQLSSLPFDIWADRAYIGALKLARGTVKFVDWSEQMISDLGEEVRPYLRQIYEKSQEILTQNSKKINDQTISKAERITESYLKSNESKLSPQDTEFIRGLAQRVSELSGAEQRIASQDLQAILNGFEKIGLGRKISALQYISLLLNPLTQIRNIVGNELLYRIERLSRTIATPIDFATSKLTGKDRTITFKGGLTSWENFFKPTQDFFTALPEGLRAGWRGVSPEGLTSKYEIQGQAFRSKYNPLTYLEKTLGAALQGFDYAAYTRAVNQNMREMAYLDAINKGVKGAGNIRSHMQSYLLNMDDAVHDIARKYGKYVTLQDDNVLSKGLVNFRGGLNKITAGNRDFGLGSVVAPFAKTPANLLLRGLDYSPVGILKAIKQSYDVLRKPNTDLTRADVISSVSRALFGTGIGAASYWLADKGALFGQSNADPEVRKLMQQTGRKDFQVNGSAFLRMIDAMANGGDIDEAAKIQPNDTLWAYEWAQPTSLPIAVGANVFQGTQEQQSALKTAGEATAAGFGTLFNASVLSGIREAFQIPPGEDNAVKAIGLNLIKQVPGLFTPSIARNINTLLDDRVKETYSPDQLESILNPAQANIPGLSQELPQRVSTLGEPQTRLNTFVDVFLSPAQRSQYKPTPEAQLVIDLLNETGDTRVAPRAVRKYITGKDIATNEQRKVDLTPEQYVRLQTITGQEAAKRIAKIDPSLSSEIKIKKVIRALDEAGKIGSNELKKELGLRKSR